MLQDAPYVLVRWIYMDGSYLLREYLPHPLILLTIEGLPSSIQGVALQHQMNTRDWSVEMLGRECNSIGLCVYFNVFRLASVM